MTTPPPLPPIPALTTTFKHFRGAAMRLAEGRAAACGGRGRRATNALVDLDVAHVNAGVDAMSAFAPNAIRGVLA